VASIVGGVLLILAGLAVLIVIFVIRLVKTNRVKSAAAQQPGSGWSPPGSGWSPPGAQPPPGPGPPPS
jgi:hypothetical protein